MKNAKKTDLRDLVILTITIFIFTLVTRNWPVIKQFILT